MSCLPLVSRPVCPCYLVESHTALVLLSVNVPRVEPLPEPFWSHPIVHPAYVQATVREEGADVWKKYFF